MRILACLLLLLCRSSAGVVRRSWVFEQAVQPLLITESGQRRHQVSIGATNYGDSLSVEAAGVIGLSIMEVEVRYSERIFPGVTDRGRELKSALNGEKHLIGVNLGRYFVSRSGHFGRLGIQAFKYLPGNVQMLGLTFMAGLRDPFSPWSARIVAAFQMGLPRELALDQASLSAQVGHRFGGLRLGGFLTWSHALGETAADPSRIEHMLFSFGPFAELRVLGGLLRAKGNVRMFLDKELINGERSYPNGFLSPDLNLAWLVPL